MLGSHKLSKLKENGPREIVARFLLWQTPVNRSLVRSD